MNPRVQDIAIRSSSRGVTRLVLLALALELNEASVCTASTGRLAALAGIKRNHIGRHINKLVKAGEVAVELMAGPNRCNIYRLLPGRGESQGGAPQAISQEEPVTYEESAFEALCALRASAWASFHPCGRTWHQSTEGEREAFACSEQGKQFLLEARKLARGIPVIPTGEINLQS